MLQTVRCLLELDKQVFVMKDAYDSRNQANKAAGLARMRGAGEQVVTREMVVFELMGSASHPSFRHISKTFLVGEQP